MNDTKILHQVSTETTQDIFELPDDVASKHLISDITTNWDSTKGWTHSLASQLPLETMGNTPFYYEAADIHHQPSDIASWLADERISLVEWMKRLRRQMNQIDEQSGTTKVRLLDLHCPALPHCNTAFSKSRETADQGGFQMEIMGFGGGSKYTATFSDTLLISAKEKCLEVWVPLSYIAKRYKLYDRSAMSDEQIITTVKPTQIGEDIEILPAQCKGDKCSMISSSNKPKVTYTLTSAATISKGIKYKTGASMKTLLGIDLPWNFKIGLEANISFNYAVEYKFNLEGPGKFMAYDILHLAPRWKTNENSQIESRITVEKLGFAWEWNKNTE